MIKYYKWLFQVDEEEEKKEEVRMCMYVYQCDCSVCVAKKHCAVSG